MSPLTNGTDLTDPTFEEMFATIPEAINEIKKGKMVIVVDDPSRENEGDLVLPAEKVTPQTINFMAKYGRGLICLPIIGERLDELKISPMVEENTVRLSSVSSDPEYTEGNSPKTDYKETAFTISINAKKGITTGISAYDRARTIKTILNPKTKPEDLSRPGHIFPLRYKEGGVLVRAGHTEAAVDLAKLAGLYPASVICEIMYEDGTMARLPELLKFAQKYKLKIITIADLIEYRRKTEKLIRRVSTSELPTIFGNFTLHVYEDTINREHHLVLVKGKIEKKKDILVRVHSSCLTGETFHSLRCDCGEQLHQALEMIAQEGRGVLLYMHQEGRGIGLVNKIHSYALQDQGLDTVEANRKLGYPADLRDYGIGAQILVDLGLKNIRLLTNNPRKISGLQGYSLKIVERIPIEIEPKTAIAYRYLKTKKKKLGHLINTV